MKKGVTLVFLLLLAAASLFGQVAATVRETTGKVEVKPEGGSWQTATRGMKLSRGFFISTGFNSSAVLDIDGSVLQVKPLTRMQLQELIKTEETVSADLFLKVGKVKAEVRSVEGRVLDFKVRSAVTTAAVRGTEFEFDGLSVKVINGEVTFTNLYEQSRTVRNGEKSGSDGRRIPTSGQQERDIESTVQNETSYAELEGIRRVEPPLTSVTVQWIWQ